VRAVADGLDRSLEEGRRAVSQIVGRDPETLDASGVSRAAIESLAESSSDGVVAPLFWLLLFGLPGIAIYKAINTADSMVGHRTDRHFDFGWASAKLDDVVNWIPARLTALSFVLTAPLAGGSGWAGARVGRLHHGRTLSPNAGWTMATAAGVLGVRLCKRGEYSLGEPGHPIEVGDVRRAWRLSLLSTGLAFALTAATAALRTRFA
jgi:adenosylcobinamide-phosphate synthase